MTKSAPRPGLLCIQCPIKDTHLLIYLSICNVLEESLFELLVVFNYGCCFFSTATLLIFVAGAFSLLTTYGIKMHFQKAFLAW